MGESSIGASIFCIIDIGEQCRLAIVSLGAIVDIGPRDAERRGARQCVVEVARHGAREKICFWDGHRLVPGISAIWNEFSHFSVFL